MGAVVDTLRDMIGDWTDIDIAEWHLARSLGLMGPEIDFAVRAEHVFWSDNPVGNMLDKILRHLIDEGILEVHPDDDSVVRWNKAFVGTWEHKV